MGGRILRNTHDAGFSKFIKLGDKKDESSGIIFENYSLGINTNRDAWCYNFSEKSLKANMVNTISFYNSEASRFASQSSGLEPEAFVDGDKTRISWTSSLIPKLRKGMTASFENGEIVKASYRPFSKTKLFYDATFNHRRGQMPKIFPNSRTENLTICVTGIGSQRGYSILITDLIADIHFQQNGQCFPMFLFEQLDESSEHKDLFGSETPQSLGGRRRDGITDAGLKHYEDAYPAETITKEDLFYYVYGLLHSEDYRAKYADNLSKELPRIPRVKTAADIWAFSRAGRTLGDLHVNYESVEPYPVTIKQGDLRLTDIKNPEAFYRVTKWAFGKTGKDKDKTTVIYNPNITMQAVPLEAYDYVVNGKPALEWVMERQVVKTDKASGIENDANRYAVETMNNPAYPLELFQRVITVSLRTMEIVRSLPKMEVM
jgi:predicted helicase